MAIALVGSLGAVKTAAPWQASFGQATTAGNLLIMWATGSGDNTIDQGWSNFGIDIWYKANCGAGETAPTLTPGANTPKAIMLGEFSGVATSSPADLYNFGQSFSSPNTTTLASPDASSGELLIAVNLVALTKSGTHTSTTSFNNGATSLGNVNDDSTSGIYHYRFSYGITTGNSAADSLTSTSDSMNVSTVNGRLASFKVASTTPVDTTLIKWIQGSVGRKANW